MTPEDLCSLVVVGDYVPMSANWSDTDDEDPGDELTQPRRDDGFDQGKQTQQTKEDWMSSSNVRFLFRRSVSTLDQAIGDLAGLDDETYRVEHDRRLWLSGLVDY